MCMLDMSIFFFYSSIFRDELHQSYSGEMCDKLENHLVNYL